jgi:predicted Zn-dependent peptidase
LRLQKEKMSHAETRTLSNGLRVLERELPGPVFHVRAAVRVGFDDEDPSTLQAAHFLEHMLAKYTSSRYPSGKKNAAFLAKRGATTNASTGAWTTDYFVEAPVTEASQVLRLVTPALCDFQIDQTAVANEGNSVREELKMRWIDDVFFDGEKEAARWMYGDHVRAQSGEAHIANVERLVEDPSILTQFYRTHYSPRRMVLIVVGPLSTLRPMLTRMYAKLSALPPGGSHVRPAPAVLPDVATRTFEAPKATSLKVELRWPLATLHGDLARQADALVAQRVLSGSMDSRLMRVLRTQHGMVYGLRLHATFDRHDPALSCVTFETTCRPADGARLVEHVLREVGKPISKHEAQRVRMGLRRALMHREYALSPSRVAEELQTDWLWHERVEDDEARLQRAFARLDEGANTVIAVLRDVAPHITFMRAATPPPADAATSAEK